MGKKYIVHAGEGVAQVGGSTVYIEAPELAALYGLDPEDYEVGAPMGEAPVFTAYSIHLIPRPDGRYRNIKNELGDTGDQPHYRRMVNYDKWKKRNSDINGNNARF